MSVTDSLPPVPGRDVTHAPLVLLCVCMPLGIVGNGLVLYAFRLEASAFNSLVTFLASADLFACLFHMPLDIASLFDPYMVADEAICKISCFMIAFTAISSSALLVAIAANRYRAVCRPHSKLWTVRDVNVIAAVSFGLAMILSGPVVLMFGVTILAIDDIVYAFCGVQNEFMDKPQPKVFYLILTLLFIVTLCALCIIYVMTGRGIWSKRKIFADTKVQYSSTPRNKPAGGNGVGVSDTSMEVGLDAHREGSAKQIARSKVTSNDKKTSKSFRIMFLVSLVFFLSYTPHLTLVFYFMVFNKAAFPVHALSHWYGIAMRSYYINNVVDPFIYGFFSQDFRRNIQTIPGKLKIIGNKICGRS